MLRKYQNSPGQIGKYSREKLEQCAIDCISALSNLLGEKQYMFTEDSWSFLDISVFAATSQVLFVTPASSKVRKQLTKCLNLLKHHGRIQKMAFPDWTQLAYQEE